MVKAVIIKCYQTLESYLIDTGDNKYQLRKAFFPPQRIPTVFVAVTYQYGSQLKHGSGVQEHSTFTNHYSTTSVSVHLTVLRKSRFPEK